MGAKVAEREFQLGERTVESSEDWQWRKVILLWLRTDCGRGEVSACSETEITVGRDDTNLPAFRAQTSPASGMNCNP